MERSEIAGVESDEAENDLNSIMVNKGKEEKILPPASSPTKKLQEQLPSSQTKERQKRSI